MEKLNYAIRRSVKAATVSKVGNVDEVNAKYIEYPVYTPLLAEDCGTSVRYVSDVSLLFNQQRLDRMSLQALKEKIDEHAQLGNDGLASIRSKLTDEQLSQFVKSRYIQSLSELRQWTTYLEKNFESEVANINAALAAKAAREKQVVNPTSPTGAAPAASAGE